MAGFSPIGSVPFGSLPTDGTYYPPPGGIVFHGNNCISNQKFPSGAHAIFQGVTPIAVLAAPRVTWFGLEVAHGGLAFNRVTWFGLEVLRTAATQPTEWVVSWFGMEVAHVGAAAWRVSWMGVEVLRSVARQDSGWVSLLCG